jgi:GNAT superfamily N-acetyltransferase
MSAELLLRADRALAGAVVHLARAAGGGAQDEDGLVLFAGLHNYPGPYCNGLIRLDRQQAPEVVIERGRGFFSPRRRGFVVWARGGADDDLTARCRAAGLHERPPAIGMPLVIRESPLEPGEAAEHVSTEITTETAAEDYLSILGDAYGMADAPAALRRAIFFTPAAVLHPAAVGLLLHADGRAAAGAMAVLTDDVACVLWVATSQWARGRGLGTASMRAITEAAFGRGATLIVAQSSQMGLPHWTRLGFSEVGHYHRFLAR